MWSQELNPQVGSSCKVLCTILLEPIKIQFLFIVYHYCWCSRSTRSNAAQSRRRRNFHSPHHCGPKLAAKFLPNVNENQGPWSETTCRGIPWRQRIYWAISMKSREMWDHENWWDRIDVKSVSWQSRYIPRFYKKGNLAPSHQCLRSSRAMLIANESRLLIL